MEAASFRDAPSAGPKCLANNVLRAGCDGCLCGSRGFRRNGSVCRYRETINLPAGQPVRHNKALGGAPGRGELTAPRAVPSQAILKIVPLR